ncbi:MAG: hypothetical protein RR348_01605, partial [Clostridia bacterium]
MKKKLVTIFLLLTIVFSCVFVFVACDSKYDIVGTWETTDNGYYSSATFYRNGTVSINTVNRAFVWSNNKKDSHYYEIKDPDTGECVISVYMNNENEKKPTLKMCLGAIW